MYYMGGPLFISKSASLLHNEGSLRDVENRTYVIASEFILFIGIRSLELSIYFSRSIRSIDISDVAIRQMSEQNKSRPELIFEKMDVMNMDYKVGTVLNVRVISLLRQL